jgi:hypothetical protein
VHCCMQHHGTKPAGCTPKAEMQQIRHLRFRECHEAKPDVLASEEQLLSQLAFEHVTLLDVKHSSLAAWLHCAQQQ